MQSKSVMTYRVCAYVIHGAAPCPIHVKQAATEWLGPIIFEYYATTEGGHVFCEPQQWLNKPGTVGKAAEGYGVKILDDAGNELSPGVDGYLYFTGRSAELVICGGVNVYLAQVDAVLIQNPSIEDVATIGVPNEEFGEEIKAIVQLKPSVTPGDAVRQSILDFGRPRLTGFMRPRTVEFVPQILRSEGGKILRKKIREKYVPAK